MFTKRQVKVKFETKRPLIVIVSTSVFLSSKYRFYIVMIRNENISALIPKWFIKCIYTLWKYVDNVHNSVTSKIINVWIILLLKLAFLVKPKVVILNLLKKEPQYYDFCNCKVLFGAVFIQAHTVFKQTMYCIFASFCTQS